MYLGSHITEDNHQCAPLPLSEGIMEFPLEADRDKAYVEERISLHNQAMKVTVSTRPLHPRWNWNVVTTANYSHLWAVSTPTVSFSRASTRQGFPARSSARERSSTGSFPMTPEQVKPLVQSSNTPWLIDVCWRAKLKQKPRIGGSPLHGI